MTVESKTISKNQLGDAKNSSISFITECVQRDDCKLFLQTLACIKTSYNDLVLNGLNFTALEDHSINRKNEEELQPIVKIFNRDDVCIFYAILGKFQDTEQTADQSWDEQKQIILELTKEDKNAENKLDILEGIYLSLSECYADIETSGRYSFNSSKIHVITDMISEYQKALMFEKCDSALNPELTYYNAIGNYTAYTAESHHTEL